MCELVPPAFPVPFSTLLDAVTASLIFVYHNWPTELKYVEERIIVEDVDRCVIWPVLRPTALCLLKVDGNCRGKGRTFGVLTQGLVGSRWAS